MPTTPDANALPGQPAPRPLAGPILPLVASSVGTDQLLGGPGSRPVAIDALAARVLVKGEPLSAPAGRADDFAWPRREVGHERVKGETAMAMASPDVGARVTAPAASLKSKKHRSWRLDRFFARSVVSGLMEEEREAVRVRGDGKNGRCRMQGGPSAGAPKGNTNVFRHGHYATEVIWRRRGISAPIRIARALE
jgi:hypothetical protein